jgi:hypothetical protein
MNVCPMSQLKEIHLIESLEVFFGEHGFQTFTEVRMVNRWVDLIAVGNGRIIAVELKLDNWRQAIRQALAYQLGADYSVVGMPLGKAIDAYRNRYYFRKEGVGLFGVRVRTPEVRVLIEPEPSTRIMPTISDNLFEMVEVDGESIIVPRSSKHIREKHKELQFVEACDYEAEESDDEESQDDNHRGD